MDELNSFSNNETIFNPFEILQTSTKTYNSSIYKSFNSIDNSESSDSQDDLSKLLLEYSFDDHNENDHKTGNINYVINDSSNISKKSDMNKLNLPISESYSSTGNIDTDYENFSKNNINQKIVFEMNNSQDFVNSELNEDPTLEYNEQCEKKNNFPSLEENQTLPFGIVTNQLYTQIEQNADEKSNISDYLEDEQPLMYSLEDGTIVLHYPISDLWYQYHDQNWIPYGTVDTVNQGIIQSDNKNNCEQLDIENNFIDNQSNTENNFIDNQSNIENYFIDNQSNIENYFIDNQSNTENYFIDNQGNIENNFIDNQSNIENNFKQREDQRCDKYLATTLETVQDKNESYKNLEEQNNFLGIDDALSMSLLKQKESDVLFESLFNNSNTKSDYQYKSSNSFDTQTIDIKELQKNPFWLTNKKNVDLNNTYLDEFNQLTSNNSSPMDLTILNTTEQYNITPNQLVFRDNLTIHNTLKNEIKPDPSNEENRKVYKTYQKPNYSYSSSQELMVDVNNLDDTQDWDHIFEPVMTSPLQTKQTENNDILPSKDTKNIELNQKYNSPIKRKPPQGCLVDAIIMKQPNISFNLLHKKKIFQAMALNLKIQEDLSQTLTTTVQKLRELITELNKVTSLASTSVGLFKQGNLYHDNKYPLSQIPYLTKDNKLIRAPQLNDRFLMARPSTVHKSVISAISSTVSRFVKGHFLASFIHHYRQSIMRASEAEAAKYMPHLAKYLTNPKIRKSIIELQNLDHETNICNGNYIWDSKQLFAETTNKINKPFKQHYLSRKRPLKSYTKQNSYRVGKKKMIFTQNTQIDKTYSNSAYIEEQENVRGNYISNTKLRYLKQYDLNPDDFLLDMYISSLLDPEIKYTSGSNEIYKNLHNNSQSIWREDISLYAALNSLPNYPTYPVDWNSDLSYYQRRMQTEGEKWVFSRASQYISALTIDTIIATFYKDEYKFFVKAHAVHKAIEKARDKSPPCIIKRFLPQLSKLLIDWEWVKDHIPTIQTTTAVSFNTHSAIGPGGKRKIYDREKNALHILEEYSETLEPLNLEIFHDNISDIYETLKFDTVQRDHSNNISPEQKINIPSKFWGDLQSNSDQNLNSDNYNIDIFNDHRISTSDFSMCPSIDTMIDIMNDKEISAKKTQAYKNNSHLESISNEKLNFENSLSYKYNVNEFQLNEDRNHMFIPPIDCQTEFEKLFENLESTDINSYNENNTFPCHENNTFRYNENNTFPCHENNTFQYNENNTFPCHENNTFRYNENNTFPCHENNTFQYNENNTFPCHENNIYQNEQSNTTKQIEILPSFDSTEYSVNPKYKTEDIYKPTDLQRTFTESISPNKLLLNDNKDQSNLCTKHNDEISDTNTCITSENIIETDISNKLKLYERYHFEADKTSSTSVYSENYNDNISTYNFPNTTYHNQYSFKQTATNYFNKNSTKKPFHIFPINDTNNIRIKEYINDQQTDTKDQSPKDLYRNNKSFSPTNPVEHSMNENKMILQKRNYNNKEIEDRTNEISNICNEKLIMNQKYSNKNKLSNAHFKDNEKQKDLNAKIIVSCLPKKIITEYVSKEENESNTDNSSKKSSKRDCGVNKVINKILDYKENEVDISYIKNLSNALYEHVNNNEVRFPKNIVPEEFTSLVPTIYTKKNMAHLVVKQLHLRSGERSILVQKNDFNPDILEDINTNDFVFSNESNQNSGQRIMTSKRFPNKKPSRLDDQTDILRQCTQHLASSSIRSIFLVKICSLASTPKFTPAIDSKLIDLVEKHNLSWTEIAEILNSGHSTFDLVSRYQTKLTPLNNPTDAETRAVVTLSLGRSWLESTMMLPVPVLSYTIYQQYSKSAVPGLCNYKWTTAEDIFTILGVTIFGAAWKVTSELLPNRSDRKVRERWRNVLSRISLRALNNYFE